MSDDEAEPEPPPEDVDLMTQSVEFLRAGIIQAWENIRPEQQEQHYLQMVLRYCTALILRGEADALDYYFRGCGFTVVKVNPEDYTDVDVRSKSRAIHDFTISIAILRRWFRSRHQLDDVNPVVLEERYVGLLPMALLNCGTAHVLLKEFEDGLRDLHESAKLEPRRASIWNQLGFAHYKQGDCAEAAKFYAKAFDRGDFASACHQGHMLHMLQQYDEALKWYNRALGGPDMGVVLQASCYIRRCFVHCHLDRPDLAEADLESAYLTSARFPRTREYLGIFVDAAVDFGRAYVEMNQSEAVTRFKQIVSEFVVARDYEEMCEERLRALLAGVISEEQFSLFRWRVRILSDAVVELSSPISLVQGIF